MTQQQSRHRRKDASMTLLTAVMEKSLDPGYAAVARARAAGINTPVTLRQRLVVLVLAVLIGMGTVVATQALRAPQPAASSARTLIVDQIRERSATGEELQTGNTELREEIAEMQSQVLGDEDEAFLARTAELETAVGTVPVQGPGLVITLEDSVRAAADEPGSEDERVQDFDLQVVANGLWASGAEAVAVNGHRLTSLTAIRSAGAAILVDLQPLVSPYRIEAIGEPEAMRAEFARSSAQSHLTALSAAFSIPSSLTEEEHLQLPGAGYSSLRYAEAVDEA